MAAGMGSRYGGLKQIDPVSDKGEIILDFSLYDAMMAGFEGVIFVIKEENEADFRTLIDERAGKHMNVRYAFQKLEDIPEGYKVPEGREKPWGTCHAVMSARHLVNGPFAVINADDYYGPGAFQSMYDFLEKSAEEAAKEEAAGTKSAQYEFCMIGYELKNTITENGHVSRGVCDVTDGGYLKDIVERTKIMRRDGGIQYTEDGESWITLPEDTVVSMNFWGFSKDMMTEMVAGFPEFLDEVLKTNPLKGEYFLPGVVDTLLKEEKARVRVLRSRDKWYGVTYKEDKQTVVDALQAMKDKGLYPDVLWK